MPLLRTRPDSGTEGCDQLSAVLLYPHTLAGLEECYIAALPFFGYTLLGNLAFSAAFFGGEALAARVVTPQPAVEKATETV